jgi:hypothetical protein
MDHAGAGDQGGTVMAEFRAKVTPQLTERAQQLVTAYNLTYGSAGPGCNPSGIAAVLRLIAAEDMSIYVVIAELDPVD